MKTEVMEWVEVLHKLALSLMSNCHGCRNFTRFLQVQCVQVFLTYVVKGSENNGVG